MTADRDVVDRYLDELALRLHGPAAHIRRVLAEVDDHLTEALERAGKDPAAREDVLTRFGPSASVAAAWNRAWWERARRPLALAAVTSAGRLVAAGLIAMGVTGLVARLVAAATSVGSVYGYPARAEPAPSSCRHWLAVQPQVLDCRQAAALEASSDLTALLTVAGVVGVALGLALAVQRRRGHSQPIVLPPVLLPSLSTALFAVGAAGCALLAASNAVVLATWGAGLFWTAAGVCAVAALVGSRSILRALPDSATGPFTTPDAAC